MQVLQDSLGSIVEKLTASVKPLAQPKLLLMYQIISGRKKFSFFLTKYAIMIFLRKHFGEVQALKLIHEFTESTDCP